ncbi:MAG TPA: choice-of-anchor Q domain-containing protein [Bryobacteraceae bacterium]|jgi:hypothetical protein|nr:choice-of-anchor Q domain-containing protein [Bryobacteraceae bacterium]
MSKTIKGTYRFRNGRAAAAAAALRPAVLATSLLSCAALSALAQTTITVNSTAQEATASNPNGIVNGNCTLGEAIISANTGTPVDARTFTGSGAPYTIQLPNQQFSLSSPQNYWYGPNALPAITSAIDIEGNGATLQIASGVTRLRFFYVGANPQATGTLNFNTPGAGNLTLHNMTLTGGRQKGGEAGGFGGSGGAGMGGAIFNQGALQLIAVTMSGNSATGGSNTLSSDEAGGGGGLGQDASTDFSMMGGGFGGPVTPAGSTGGGDSCSGQASCSQGGGGGGFGPTDNGTAGNQGGQGGGPNDGPGGMGYAPNYSTGHGSGSGANANYATFCSGGGGNFGTGGSWCGGGGVGGGGGNDIVDGVGGGGGFGGGSGSDSMGGFGGGSDDTEHHSYGGSSRGSGAGMGGAIFNHGGTLSITNSTLTANSAIGGGGGEGYGGASGFGGAIFNLNGAVTFEFSTLDANTVAVGQSTDPACSAAGGAVYSVGYNLISGQAATLTISSSILADSIGGVDLVSDQPSNVADASGGGANAATASVTYLGSSIVMSSSLGSSALTGPSPLPVSPQLAVLTLNSPGLTPTMAITNSSPAFDAAECDPNVTTDQRGVSRPQGTACDIGAYELMLTAQTITFTGLPANVTFGSTNQFFLTATASSSLPVTLSVTGPATLDGTVLTVSAPGTVTVTATQEGNGTYAPATPVTLTMAVSQASQTITFTGLPSTLTFTSSVIYTLNATASSGMPVSLSVTGPAVLSAPNLAVTGAGTVTVTASQPGNNDYAAATPVTLTLVVTLGQTITFTGLPGTATYGAAGPYTLNATASSGLPVSYSITGPASLAGSALTITGPGTVSVTAAQAGNSTYNPATSVTQSIVVSQASETITFTGLPGTATYGSASPYTLNATASSGLPVSYSITGPASLSGSTLTITGAGTVTVTASQAGNTNYAAATPVTLTIIVAKISQTITFTALPGTATYGSAGPYTLNATASSGLPVSYSVTGPASLSGSTLTITGAGTVTVTASQAGNTNYAAAVPVTQTIVVSKTSRTITFHSIANQNQGTPVTLSASASSGLAVTFTSLTTRVCTVSGDTATLIAAGTCSIQGSQAGNAQYAAANPVTQSFTAASFTITPDPGSETVTRGVLAAFLLQVKSVDGFKGDVKLSCSGGPSGAECADLPQTVSVNGTALAVSGILFPANTTPGTYTMTFTGVSGSLTNSATATFTVVK